MKRGTKSVLWGTHQFIYHPITVAIAWRRLYGSWPNWWQWISIFLHDTPGYWGCKSMDGEDGIRHPQRGANWAAKVVGIFSAESAYKAYFLCRNHSSTFSKLYKEKTSALYLPDKASILVESKNFYLFRARLSGEIHEYVKNSPHKDEADWYLYYRASVARKLKTHAKN